MRWIIPFLMSAGFAFGECPPAKDVTSDILALIDEARIAPDAAAGQAVSNRMWQVWLQAPDEAAQTVLDQGMSRRSSYDFAGAFEAFDRLVNYCPGYAEGYNQRAFVSFLREDYPAALVDLDLALELSPHHVGAQSGRALTLMNMGRIEEARAQLLEAVENNPWLNEAALLAKGAPLGPVGEDI
jgi:tetratricopeptide (TPR) repeat protein